MTKILTINILTLFICFQNTYSQFTKITTDVSDNGEVPEAVEGTGIAFKVQTTNGIELMEQVMVK
jgi:hypothetical protein